MIAPTIESTWSANAPDWSEVPLLLQECRVEILRAVRDEPHRGQEQHQVQEPAPGRRHGPHVGAPVGSMLMPGLGLLDLGEHEDREQRRETAEKEHVAPGVCRVEPLHGRIDHQEREGGEQVAERVALVQQPREHAAPARRHVSSTSEAPIPHCPPMPMPKRPRSTRNHVKDGASPDKADITA